MHKFTKAPAQKTLEQMADEYINAHLPCPHDRSAREWDLWFKTTEGQAYLKRHNELTQEFWAGVLGHYNDAKCR